MIGTCDAEYGLVAELWKKGKGFSLHLDFKSHFEPDEENRDALSVGVSHSEKDDFLEEYYPLLGPLRHYVKAMS